VVTRHPATIRRVAQALGACGIGVNHALSTAQMPRAAADELAVVVLDLDIDPNAAPMALVNEVVEIYPHTPLVVVAGLHAKKRLLSTLPAPTVRHIVPKLGGFLDLPPDQRSFDGPDEQDLAVALRRIHADVPPGASPYLIPGFSTTETIIDSSNGKDHALESVLELANALELSEEKKRRIEVATEELVLNGVYDAPRGSDGKPLYAGVDRRTAVSLGESARVKLHYGCDGRNFVVSVRDPFGALERSAVVRSMLKLVEPEPSCARCSSWSSPTRPSRYRVPAAPASA
jgi:hypothetical protein